MSDSGRFSTQDRDTGIDSSLFRTLNVPSWTDPLNMDAASIASTSTLSLTSPSKRGFKSTNRGRTNVQKRVGFTYKDETAVSEYERSLSPEPGAKYASRTSVGSKGSKTWGSSTGLSGSASMVSIT